MDDAPLPLLYQDDHLVAVNKPSGLLVHRSRLDRSATTFALQRVRDQIGQYVHPVHRLDKQTSGVLVFALSPEAARALMTAFAERHTEKTYLAVVRGWPPDEGLIDHALAPQAGMKTDRRARTDKPPQEARTRFRCLARTEQPFAVSRYPTSRYALVEAQPETGRTHQLRRHFNHIAHPIVGDTKHGDYRHARYFRQHLDCDRMLLHAATLTVPHPATGTRLTLDAPLPAGFRAILDRFGWTP